MVDERLRLVVGGNVALGAVLLMVHSGKRYRVAEFNRDTTEAVLEPLDVVFELKRLTYEDQNHHTPAPSKFLPGNPQPWKKRGRR